MTDGQPTAVNIHGRHVQAEVSDAGQRLRRKSFVDLNHVQIGHSETCTGQRLACGGYRTYAHDRWVHSHGREAADARQCLQTMAFGKIVAGDQHGRSAVGQRRRCARRDHAIRPEGGLEPGQGLQCGGGAYAAVGIQQLSIR
jgi:hypothetical protein